MAFQGFSTDRLVSLPPEFFTEVAPAISLPTELKVTLHLFYRLSRQRGIPRRISWDDLAADQQLQRSLRSVSALRPFTDLLAEGLDAAVRRTTLLHITLPASGRQVNWYLVNTAANRAWVGEMQHASYVLYDNPEQPAPPPSVVALYEQNIGLVTPILLEELREAEETYPADWIAEAIREAVRANARSWRYIQRILDNWATNGRTHGADQQERPVNFEKYLTGPERHLYRAGGHRDPTSD